ncbi:putative toxin-antitoxin system toxin component, PIN family [Fontivita pretiosa]|uniref:putative toxin-antitoxin system toxin component, PIN family n=1 Tax=Fontivita pretiosa TaxID=2989684 RepID=UPI003D16B994
MSSAQTRIRAVMDTNTVLRGLVSSSSAAARVLRAAEQRRFIPLLSKPVLDEHRAVLSDEELCRRFPQITAELVEVTIRRLRFVGDYVRHPRASFQFRRDPRDQKFVELAIAMHATHVVSLDEDLLSLPIGQTDASRRFRRRLPQVKVLDPGQFLLEIATTPRGWARPEDAS